MMVRGPKSEGISSPQSLTILRAMRRKKIKKTIIVGLKSCNSGREMLLQLINNLLLSGDKVLAVHVQEPEDTHFDPNTFHIYEDLCKSKQVDFHVNICAQGSSSVAAVLTHQVRVNFATTLVLGWSGPWCKESLVVSCLKGLPPTCTLLVMDKGGRIILEQAGTSQQGSATTQTTQSPFLSSSPRTIASSSETIHHPPKPSSTPSSPQLRYSDIKLPSPSTPPQSRCPDIKIHTINKTLQLPETKGHLRQLQRLGLLEAKGAMKHITPKELARGTDDFSPLMMIGEGGNSKVYRAHLADGQTVAVKLLKISERAGEDLLREAEMLTKLKHKHIIRLLGCCYSDKMYAAVYSLMKGSLKENLAHLGWGERVKIAVCVAKALNYLHHACSPPVIHRDVKSSNILLSYNCQPQLADFGSAMIHHQPQQPPANAKLFPVIGTFGYLAPEYVMYGTVDEKVDVYSFGVVLLELITGKHAIQTNQASGCESLVLWARSLLSYELCDRLIDPGLNNAYDKDELQRMMVAACLCLMHPSQRRPTMKMILRLFEEPEYWVKLQREREELANGNNSEGETGLQSREESATNGFATPKDIW